jgi:O-antigen/teichoic acid export membrane protein
LSALEGPSVPGDLDAVAAERELETKGHIRASSLLLAGQTLSIGMAFVTQVLMVRYLTKSDYGAFAYALAIVLVAQTVSMLALNRTIARFTAIYHERKSYDQLFGAILFAVGSITVVGLVTAGLTYVVFRAAGTDLVDDRTAITVLSTLIALAPIQALDDLLMSLFAVFSRVRTIFLRAYVVAPGLKLLVVVLLVAAHSNVRFLAVGFVVAGALGLAVFAAVFASILRREGLLERLELSSLSFPIRPILALAIPLLVADLTYILLTSVDGILLGYFRGTDAVAAYKAVQPAARLNEIVAASFLILFTPLASRLFARSDVAALKNLYWNTATWIAVLTFPIFIVTFALAKPFTVLAFGERYSTSASVLSILAVGYYVQVALGFNGTVLMVIGKMRYIVAAGFAAVAINVGLAVVLIPRYGAVGAAVATGSALVAHNVVKQAGLRLAGGIAYFERRYLRVYASLGLGAAGVAGLQQAVSFGAYAALPLAVIVPILVLRFNRRLVSVAETFPEVLRIPFARHVLGE